MAQTARKAALMDPDDRDVWMWQTYREWAVEEERLWHDELYPGVPMNAEIYIEKVERCKVLRDILSVLYGLEIVKVDRICPPDEQYP